MSRSCGPGSGAVSAPVERLDTSSGCLPVTPTLPPGRGCHWMAPQAAAGGAGGRCQCLHLASSFFLEITFIDWNNPTRHTGTGRTAGPLKWGSPKLPLPAATGGALKKAMIMGPGRVNPGPTAHGKPLKRDGASPGLIPMPAALAGARCTGGVALPQAGQLRQARCRGCRLLGGIGVAQGRPSPPAGRRPTLAGPATTGSGP